MRITDVTSEQSKISMQLQRDIFDSMHKHKIDNELSRRTMLLLLVANYQVKAENEGLSKMDVQRLMSDEIKQVMDKCWNPRDKSR